MAQQGVTSHKTARAAQLLRRTEAKQSTHGARWRVRGALRWAVMTPIFKRHRASSAVLHFPVRKRVEISCSCLCATNFSLSRRSQKRNGKNSQTCGTQGPVAQQLLCSLIHGGDPSYLLARVAAVAHAAFALLHFLFWQTVPSSSLGFSGAGLWAAGMPSCCVWNGESGFVVRGLNTRFPEGRPAAAQSIPSVGVALRRTRPEGRQLDYCKTQCTTHQPSSHEQLPSPAAPSLQMPWPVQLPWPGHCRLQLVPANPRWHTHDWPTVTPE